MQPTLVNIESFLVMGIKTRTNNANEMIPAQAKLPLLWGQFLRGDLSKNTANQVENSPIYSVYSGYQSDCNGDYDVIIGVNAEQSNRTDVESITVKPGNYLMFEGKGDMPQTVISLWEKIWRYFSEKQSVTRIYTTDFEVYRQNSVAIYIAVEPSYSGHN